DKVAGGDILVRLDDREASARVAAARATRAGRTGEPPADAPERPSVSEDAARAELALAETMLEQTRIRAPAAGTVLQVLVKAGELAGPALEGGVVTLGDISSLRVRAEVDERDIEKVKVGQRVAIRTDAFRGTEFAGKV